MSQNIEIAELGQELIVNTSTNAVSVNGALTITSLTTSTNTATFGSAFYIAANGSISFLTSDGSYSGNVQSAFTINANNQTGLTVAASNTQLSFALNPLSNGSWLMYDRAANGGVGVWSAGIYQANGSVGIGNTNPTNKLSVNGTTYFGNTVTFADSTQMTTAASLGMRNRIINGDFRIWQRGTSFANPTSAANQYGADRWCFVRPSYAGNTTMSQVTGLTINGNNRTAMRLQRTSGDTNTGLIQTCQAIESLNIRDLAGQTITISGYYRTGANFSNTNLYIQFVTGTGIDEPNPITNGYTGSTVAISTSVAANTNFTKFSVTGTLASNINEAGLTFIYGPSGTAGAADYFDLIDIQVEAGSVATPFERRPYGMELSLCQRYYQLISFGQYQRYGLFYCDTTTTAQGVYYSPVTFRTSPTLTFSNISLNGTVVASASAQVASCTTVYVIFNVASGLTAGTMSQLYAPTTSTSYMAYNAEL